MNDTEARIRRQIAETEAKLDALRIKLAKVTSPKGAKPPATGTDVLWAIALPMAKKRSSKHLCRTAWNRIPPQERPSIEDAVAALKIWNRIPEWKVDAGQFVPGLDKWIAQRRWEDLPDIPAEAPSRYRSTPKPVAQVPAEELAGPDDIKALLAGIASRTRVTDPAPAADLP